MANQKCNTHRIRPDELCRCIASSGQKREKAERPHGSTGRQIECFLIFLVAFIGTGHSWGRRWMQQQLPLACKSSGGAPSLLTGVPAEHYSKVEPTLGGSSPFFFFFFKYYTNLMAVVFLGLSTFCCPNPPAGRGLLPSIKCKADLGHFGCGVNE